MKVRGIVVKIKDSHCLVLASDGTYHKTPLARHKGARVGSEIEFVQNNWLNYVKPALLVASILVFALGLGLFRQAAVSPAYAYVSLDINPSVELEVGKDLKVISALPLNKDAEKLLARVKIDGLQLYTSVNSILAEAVEEGYLKPGQKNYVLSTVTLENRPSNNIDYEDLTEKMRSAVQDKGVEVELLVLSTDSKLHKEAKSKGLSTGKMVVYRQALASGGSVTMQQVKDNSITKLVNDYKIKIIPTDKKMIIKSLKIKPKKNGKDPHQVIKTIPDREDDSMENDDSDNESEMNVPGKDKFKKGNSDSNHLNEPGIKDNSNKGKTRSNDLDKKDNSTDEKGQVSPPASSGYEDSRNNEQAPSQERDTKKDNDDNRKTDNSNNSDHDHDHTNDNSDRANESPKSDSPKSGKQD